ncbi:Transcriptional regulator, contains XRE-family HTH domain [Amycolatopsis arida]|uniref:Transcriptional regulator, contains XRE-family HTH domain n=1 Tax=Amycolatopsis arida TaxID=587909 RepID=A0A1I5SK32_9PSEU|nr:helix-turn-helix domain-containing protein [Amycolatopsis arida]TDX96454.1 transcriptional regulator with XRE-family HTH domain [Amycolatopsis arida]SFP71052.1 Transcriptional regulator, contains XRE-family HTH domain [Amycolatopsis arida]
MVEQGRQGRALADKLNHLFVYKTPRDGQEYSNEQVANAISAQGDVKISQSYIWQLRKGKKDNPTFKHLQALAAFFGVPVSYFFDDEVTDRVDQQLQALKSEQRRLNEIAASSEAQLMAMRAGELSPSRRRLVMELLDVVYREEQAGRSDTED